jgi:invasion protein IalB
MASPSYLVAIAGLVVGALFAPALGQTPAAPPAAAVEPLRALDLAPTEDPDIAEPTSPEWVVTCSPGADDAAKTTCQMVQALFGENGQPTVSATIRPQAEDRRMGMLLTLPHGVYFPPGLTITIDRGRAMNVDIQTSDQNGVYAALPLTEDLITAMRLGRKLNIAMRFADGRDEIVPLTLNGFSAALERLTSLL